MVDGGRGVFEVSIPRAGNSWRKNRSSLCPPAYSVPLLWLTENNGFSVVSGYRIFMMVVRVGSMRIITGAIRWELCRSRWVWWVAIRGLGWRHLKGNGHKATWNWTTNFSPSSCYTMWVWVRCLRNVFECQSRCLVEILC